MGALIQILRVRDLTLKLFLIMKSEASARYRDGFLPIDAGNITEGSIKDSTT
jgi:hypothetical protein